MAQPLFTTPLYALNRMEQRKRPTISTGNWRQPRDSLLRKMGFWLGEARSLNIGAE
jgi:hypothetical protein